MNKSKVDKPYVVLASNNASTKVLDKFQEMSSVKYTELEKQCFLAVI